MGCPPPYYAATAAVFSVAETVAAPRAYGERGPPAWRRALTPEQQKAKRAERKRERQRRKAARR